MFFGLTCKDTCHGIAPGDTFKPPKILVIFLGSAFPQVAKGWGRAVVMGISKPSVGPIVGPSLGKTIVGGA